VKYISIIIIVHLLLCWYNFHTQCQLVMYISSWIQYDVHHSWIKKSLYLMDKIINDQILYINSLVCLWHDNSMAEPAFSMAEPAGGGETHHRSVLETLWLLANPRRSFRWSQTQGSHLQMSLVCVASGSLTMSQPLSSSSSSSNPRFRVWSPDPRLQLEVPKPGLNPGSSKPNIGVWSPAPGPGLDPRAAWGSQTRSQSRFFESNDWGLKSRSNFG